MVNPESQIYSQNNYPPQNGGPIIPTQPVYNDKYRNYQNITQINHKRIYQPNANTFYIFIFQLDVLPNYFLVYL